MRRASIDILVCFALYYGDSKLGILCMASLLEIPVLSPEESSSK